MGVVFFYTPSRPYYYTYLTGLQVLLWTFPWFVPVFGSLLLAIGYVAIHKGVHVGATTRKTRRCIRWLRDLNKTTALFKFQK